MKQIVIKCSANFVTFIKKFLVEKICLFVLFPASLVFLLGSIILAQVIAFRASRIRLKPLLKMLNVSTVTTARAPSKDSLNYEMTNDALGRIGGLTAFAEPTFLESSTAFAAGRLKHCRLLVHLTD